MQRLECKQPGCTVAVDGKCLEGLDVKNCPHCTIIDEKEVLNETTLTPTESTTIETEIKTYKEIYSGESLDINETSIITAASLTRLIILAGLPDYGKTTLLACLFDLFQKNTSFASYMFSGSKTLIGFEKICHHSRISSDRSIPVTSRTTNIEPKFLHLGLKDNFSKIELLFTDISGEFFRDYLSISYDECRKFELMRRADHFVLLIDSDLLSNINTRQTAKVSSLEVLRRLIDSEMLSPETYVQILFSKWDLLLEKKDKESHIKFVDATILDIGRKFEKDLNNLSFHKVASRPVHPNEIKQGYGFENLCKIWASNSPLTIIRPESYSKSIVCSREFSNYKA
jgi:hypothetical protein